MLGIYPLNLGMCVLPYLEIFLNYFTEYFFLLPLSGDLTVIYPFKTGILKDFSILILEFIFLSVFYCFVLVVLLYFFVFVELFIVTTFF